MDVLRNGSNSTEAQSSADSLLSNLAYLSLYFGLRGIQCVVGTTGNVLTLLILWRLKFLSKGHVLMVYLAVSDIMSCLVAPLSGVTTFFRVLKGKSSFWYKLCVVKEGFIVVSTTCSVVCYTVVSLDRWELQVLPHLLPTNDEEITIKGDFVSTLVPFCLFQNAFSVKTIPLQEDFTKTSTPFRLLDSIILLFFGSCLGFGVLSQRWIAWQLGLYHQQFAWACCLLRSTNG